MKIKKIISCITSISMFLMVLYTYPLKVTPHTAHAVDAVAYQQGDSEWGSYPFNHRSASNPAVEVESGNTLSQSACSIFSAINSVYYKTGVFLYPTDVADFAGDNGFRPSGSSGVTNGFWSAFCDTYGSQGDFYYDGSTSNAQEALDHVENGGTACYNIYNHWIAVVDYDPNTDMYLILDSARRSPSRSDYILQHDDTLCETYSDGTWTGVAWVANSFLKSGKYGLYYSAQLFSYNSNIIPPNNGNNPVGYLDSVEGGEGCVTLSGWAYDADTPNEAVEIHVYMDGGPGTGKGVAVGIIANEPREDVNEILGYPGNHGFTATIPLDVTGSHTFYAYAINRGDGDDNPKLTNEFTVNIKAPAPVTTTATTTTTTTTTTTISTTTTTTPAVTTTIATTGALSLETNEITIKAGEQFTIKANQSGLTYESNNKNIASVSKSGVITAKNAGDVLIFVSNSNEDTVVFKLTVLPLNESPTKNENNIYGDANCDGKVSVADAVAILQFIGNRDKYALTEQGAKNADVDGVAGITGKDALVIQQVDAGLYKAEDLPLKAE